jgi:hypothetical protein
VGITDTRLVASLGGSDIIPDIARRTNLAFALGGGLGIRWTCLLSVRPIQADYIPNRLWGTCENHYRLSSGVAVSLGYQATRR